VNAAKTAGIGRWSLARWVPVVVILYLAGATTAHGQWEPDVRLTNDTAASWSTWNNAWGLAAAGDTVHVAWADGRDLGDESLQFYYKRSLDGGATWGADQRLSSLRGKVHEAVIAASGPSVYVAWAETRSDDEIYFRGSSDGGTTWWPETCLTSKAWECGNVSMAASESLVHVVWWGHGDGWDACYYRRSTDCGGSWGQIRILPDAGFTFDPSVAVDRQYVHASWPNVTGAVRGIYYRRSSDRGATWGSTMYLAGTGQADGGSMAAGDSFVHIVWRDDTPGAGQYFVLYYIRSTDAGADWEPETILVYDTTHARNPTIARSGPRLHVAWWSDRTGTARLYYKHSEDNGVTWSRDTCLTDSAGNARLPSIAVAGSSVHVMWYDQRDGNKEIYYKRNPTGNTGVSEGELPDLIGRPIPAIATVVRAGLYLPEGFASGRAEASLFDVSGRSVARLHAGRNDISVLSPGMYFVRRGPATIAKVIVQK
jgi:hypothetical protein